MYLGRLASALDALVFQMAPPTEEESKKATILEKITQTQAEKERKAAQAKLNDLQKLLTKKNPLNMPAFEISVAPSEFVMQSGAPVDPREPPLRMRRLAQSK
jgi:hypothetical protein